MLINPKREPRTCPSLILILTQIKGIDGNISETKDVLQMAKETRSKNLSLPLPHSTLPSTANPIPHGGWRSPIEASHGDRRSRYIIKH